MGKNIVIRNVPATVSEVLARRAAAESLSVEDYLLRLLTDLANRPSMSEVLRRVAERREGS